MTDKLYYESSHRKDFEAQVISCEPEGEGYKVVLDKTVFFPEGGGQYADTKAKLTGKRDSKVCSNIAASISFQELYMEDSDTTM